MSRAGDLAQRSHAIVDKRLIVANKPELLKAVLDLRAKEGPACIADAPAYQAAAAAAGPDFGRECSPTSRCSRKHFS